MKTSLNRMGISRFLHTLPYSRAESSAIALLEIFLPAQYAQCDSGFRGFGYHGRDSSNKINADNLPLVSPCNSDQLVSGKQLDKEKTFC